tara:strand:+ start:7628 stop:7909 length:282 start_codon:yes stop_codon:yes gene_type:complete
MGQKKEIKKEFFPPMYKMVYVIWIDSCEPGENAEVELNEIPTPQVIQQVGMLIRDEEDYITMAGAWKPELKTMDYVITIPKFAITSIYYLGGV